MVHTVSYQYGDKTLTLETGRLARQAAGAVLVSFGETRVLVTACSAKEAKPGMDFFPLTVEYQEKYYASGKIPGSFLKREARPSSEATLAARLIDRPIRPLFPEGYFVDTQVVATVLSLDPDCDPEVAASIGASAALHISDIPFNGPTATCRIGRINGQWVYNPTWTQLKNEESDLEIMVTGTANAIMMIEGGAKEVPEDEMLAAIMEAHNKIKEICAIIEELRVKTGSVPKRVFVKPEIPADILNAVQSKATEGLKKSLQTANKADRYSLVDETLAATKEAIVPESLKESNPEEAAAKEKWVKQAFSDLQYRMMRDMILDEKRRIDGRDMKTVRPISTEVGVLPRPHGSALFTRGETQILAAVTLGTADDEQIVDSLYEKAYRKFLFHYNFPPFSVGECGRFGGQGRREIGHGALAERAVKAIAPKFDKFPYTIRVVCETLESNGSSSMGSVCASSMALMHAGVPMPKPVAGIAMGLIKESDRVAVLTDILGDEDHLGDMDFKVAGTQDGVTSIQMDIKIEGVNESIMRTALEQAREGRLHILGEMAKSITQPATDLSPWAPRITSITIPQDKIGTVIGPGGKMIKEIIAQTECAINIEDDGTVNIASNDGAKAAKAKKMIEDLVTEAELNKVYKGVVKKIVDFGAFVAILPNQEGLLHISEIAYERVGRVDEFFKEGDEVDVKVIEIDPTGKIRLSRRALLDPPEGWVEPPKHDRGGRGGGGRDRDRGGRGGGRDRDRGGRGGGDRGRRH